jgi:hypothetical protein
MTTRAATSTDRPSATTSTAGGSPTVDSKPTAELAGDLARQISELVHSEIQLAKTEVAEKGRRFGSGAGGFGIAGLFGLFGLGCLVAAAVAAVHVAIALWLSALVVGGGCFLVAGLAVLVARRQVKTATPPLPTEAIESTKEDIRWLKTQAKSASR